MNADPGKQAFVAAHIEQFVLPRLADVADAADAAAFFQQPAYREHCVRFLETYARVRRGVGLAGKRIAETGHLSGVARYLQSIGFDVAALGGDFRYSINAPSAAFDVLFSFEVFEHIKDQNSDKLEDVVLFNFSGVRRYAAEMHRVLAPGGMLALTTPNACSLRVLSEVAEGRAPWLFWPHVKEYAPAQVIDIMREAGFSLCGFDTMFACFFLHGPEAALAQYLDPIGASREHRGDVAFFLFQKAH